MLFQRCRRTCKRAQATTFGPPRRQAPAAPAAESLPLSLSSLALCRHRHHRNRGCHRRCRCHRDTCFLAVPGRAQTISRLVAKVKHSHLRALTDSCCSCVHIPFRGVRSRPTSSQRRLAVGTFADLCPQSGGNILAMTMLLQASRFTFVSSRVAGEASSLLLMLLSTSASVCDCGCCCRRSCHRDTCSLWVPRQPQTA